MSQATSCRLRRLLAVTARGASSLVDGLNEAENNLTRSENHFLRLNLQGVFALGARIARRRKRAVYLLRKETRQ